MQSWRSMSNSLKVLLLVLFLFQVLVASGFGLAHDEAYYWLYSKNLAFGYFDHPPFVGVIIRLFSFLPHHELSLRIGFILLQFGTLFTLFKMIPVEKWTRATLLFFAFPLASLTGLLALPDMPLLFMAAVYCLALKNFLEKESVMNSLILAVVISALLYAKYHGILLIFFTLVALPKLLLRKDFYVVTVISILLFLPHVYWQYEHDFSTLRYHFLERPSSSFSIKRSLEYLSLQLFLPGLFVGPVVWFSLYKHQSQSAFERAMKFMAVGICGFFLFSTFSKKFEANWTIHMMVPLLYFASLSTLFNVKSIQRLLYLSLGLVLVARVAFLLNPADFKIKRSAEFHGWQNWSLEVEKNCENQPIMANTYQIASKLSFYLNREIPALNYHSRKNQFDYWQFEKKFTSEQVCYVTDKEPFQGISLPTPEGKKMKIVPHQKLPDLLKMKADETSR